MTTPHESDDRIELREPVPEDGAALWELAREVGLDVNSPYAYLLVSRHLAPTSIVAELDGDIVGFVSAYRPPTQESVLFVWQVGVAPRGRGRGLARRMILDILTRDAARGVRWIEATVTPANTASQRLFASVARRLHADIEIKPYFGAKLFPEDGHQQEEKLHRIGPFDRRVVLEPRDDATAMFRNHESSVRRYCRLFPAVFEHARRHLVRDEDDNEYIDFHAGAGSLNYGHNDPKLQAALIGHIERDGMIQGLDAYTTTKRAFLESFIELVLAPRELDYRVLFPGPTGTNAVEAAIKLARKVTGRTDVVSFSDAYHGATLGALALSGAGAMRAGAGVPLSSCQRLPYDGYAAQDGLELFKRYLRDEGSGVTRPAAVIVETVQVAGGVHVASAAWLRRLEALCRRHDILLVVDEASVGCGRTGPFFSFEKAGLRPDLVTLAGSLSGYGLPLAAVLIRPDLDIWRPGEHDSTFGGHNLAMITATAALRTYWRDDRLRLGVTDMGAWLGDRLSGLAGHHGSVRAVRGSGLVWGIELAGDGATQVSQACFARGLLAVPVGAADDVLLVMPPLTIARAALEAGVDILADAIAAVEGDLGSGDVATPP